MVDGEKTEAGVPVPLCAPCEAAQARTLEVPPALTARAAAGLRSPEAVEFWSWGGEREKEREKERERERERESERERERAREREERGREYEIKRKKRAVFFLCIFSLSPSL